MTRDRNHDSHRASRRAPTFMIGALILGIAFALGHHFFYRYCNGKEVDQSLQQEWVTRAGTAFAFVVKMFLAIASGIAYVQECWRSLRHRPTSVRRVDALFAVLESVFMFADPGLWLLRPVLTIMAVVTWCLPIAAIITPGTITVNSTQQVLTAPNLVPQLQYDFLQFASQGCDQDGGCTYQGPSNSLARIAISSAAQGQIANIPTTQPNISYTTTFFAPAVNCESENSNVLTQRFAEDVEDGYDLQYLSWVPSTSYPNITAAPIGFTTNGSTPDLSWEDTTLDLLSTTAAKIFILAQTGFNFDNGTYEYTLLQCSLHNASYSVSFEFMYPSQTLNVLSRHPINTVAATSHPPNTQPGYGPDTHSGLSAPGVAYQSVMDAFGRVLVGQSITPTYAGMVTTGTLFPMTNLWSEIISQTAEGEPLPFPGGNATFGPKVEELFENITLSLLSSQQFLKNTSTAEAIPVTILQYRELYVYRPRDLYIAYGLSILCSLTCVVIGILALLRNEVAYTNYFSTILRTTRVREFDSVITRQDTRGGDPLPHKLGRQLVIFDDHNGEEDADEYVSGFVPYERGSQLLSHIGADSKDHDH